MRGWRRWPASSLALADHVSGPLTRTKSGTGGRHDARHRGRRHSEGLVPPSGRLPTPTPRREFRAACAPGSWVRSGDGPRRFTSHTRRIVMRTARATPANAPRTMCTPLTGCIHDGPPPAVATDQRRGACQPQRFEHSPWFLSSRRDGLSADEPAEAPYGRGVSRGGEVDLVSTRTGSERRVATIGGW